MHRTLLLPAMVAGLATLAFGQMTTVIPSGAAATEGSSSTGYPFNTNNTNGHRIQYCYSAATVGTTMPVVIRGMRFRSNGSTTGSWTGGTYDNAVVKLSTAAVPFNAMTTTFASNEGGDVVTVFTGTITVQPTPTSGSTNPGVWYVDIQFQNQFLYDASKGDLLLDVTLPGPRNGGTSYSHDMLINSPNDCYRVYSYSDASSPTGSGPYSAGLVIELQYNPANGIYADFKATPVEGTSPLQVQFTDTTFTSDPNGVTKWEWDFNNDQVVDSTVQNPQFTFTGVGYDVKYTVSLKTTDGTNGSSTETKKDLITVNPFPVASAKVFGQGSTIPAGVPGPMQLPAFSSTYSYTYTRGFYFQAPITFTINSFNVPNEASKPEQSVWFFTYPGATPPSSYAVTAADTQFFGTGPTSAPLTPTAPIVIQKDTWCGVFGACHDPSSTTMENSYSASATNHPTTILGAPTVLTRLLFQNPLVGANGTGSVSTATSGQIGRVELGIPGNLQSTIPLLEATGDTPYFGGSPQLDMTASIPGANVGVLFAALKDIPGGSPSPYGRIFVDPSTIFFAVPMANGSGSLQLTIPVDKKFADLHILWQGTALDTTNSIFGMTNGIDWLIGQQ
jgi:PKD repeat protein